MTHLITGEAGFIGSNFVKHMLKAYPNTKLVIFDVLTYAGNLGTLQEELKNKQIIFVKGDICTKEDTEQVFKDHNVSYVVNFAAESHVDRSTKNPQLFLEVNVLGAQNLLNTAKKFWTTGTDENNYPTWREEVKFLQVSTDEVYGSLGTEGFFTEETPLDPCSPDSAGKTGGDLIVRAYGETYNMPLTITRCSNNYGPYHFPEKLIPLIIRNILEGKQLPVYGDGKNVRDWLYVQDHCKAIDKVLHAGRVEEVYNVGGHNEKTNIDIVKLVIDTIHHIMNKEPQYRKVLKKQEKSANGDIGKKLLHS